MAPYMAQPRYSLNSRVLAIFFLSANISAIPHYLEFTNRHSTRSGTLSFSLHFMIHSAFLIFLLHSRILSQSHDRSRSMHATISEPTDRILVSLPQPFLSHSSDLDCVRAQRVMFLGRFLV